VEVIAILAENSMPGKNLKPLTKAKKLPARVGQLPGMPEKRLSEKQEKMW